MNRRISRAAFRHIRRFHSRFRLFRRLPYPFSLFRPFRLIVTGGFILSS